MPPNDSVLSDGHGFITAVEHTLIHCNPAGDESVVAADGNVGPPGGTAGNPVGKTRTHKGQSGFVRGGVAVSVGDVAPGWNPFHGDNACNERHYRVVVASPPAGRHRVAPWTFSKGGEPLFSRRMESKANPRVSSEGADFCYTEAEGIRPHIEGYGVAVRTQKTLTLFDKSTTGQRGRPH